MASSRPGRLLIDDRPQPGSWNMAVDETLLESAVAGQPCTLRWYRWDRATLSLGYFQRPSEVANDPHWRDVPVVRRLSGGGAILHEHEWTYSLTLPANDPLAMQPTEVYGLVHRAIVDVLRAQGIDVRLRGDAEESAAASFLCFARGDRHDVVFGRHKVLGSAQRRRRGAVLQHGSLLLRRSSFAPDFPGLEDLVPGISWEESVFPEIVTAVLQVIGGDPNRSNLTEAERRRAENLDAGLRR